MKHRAQRRASSRLGFGRCIGISLLFCLFFLLLSHPPIGDGRPSYCRVNFPGCVPLDIRYLFVLHIPKTGGTSLYHFLKNATGLRWGTVPCNLAPLMGQTFCSGKSSPVFRGSVQSMLGLKWPIERFEQRRQACRQQAAAIQDFVNTDPFTQLGCNAVIEGHYDMGLVTALPHAILKHTLIIATFREPFERLVSAFYHLKSMDKGATMANTTLEMFFNKGFADEDTANRITKTLAGEYCCYNGNTTTVTPKFTLDSAVHNLRMVGAIVNVDKMQMSLKYLAWLLQLDSHSRLDLRERENPHPIPHTAQEEVQTTVALDDMLHAHVNVQFLEQLATMGNPTSQVPK